VTYQPGYCKVWYYHPDGIEKIWSLARVKEKYRVTFNSGAKDQFIIHKDDETARCF
jgi:hypothetical protein